MFCFTSGTTGDPKACMLSHEAFISATGSVARRSFDMTPDDSYISYLPLAHSLETSFVCAALQNGIKIGFYSGDPLKLLDDMQALKPTMFPSVPRLFNRIYEKITNNIRSKSAF